MKNLLAALTLILLMTAAAFTQDAKVADLKKIESVAAKGPFKANWKSLENYKVPDWYQDAKFGIFIHWGVGEGATKVNEGPFAESKRKDFTADDIRFTTRGATLYAIALDWPASGKLTIKSVTKAKVKNVSLLGHRGKLNWQSGQSRFSRD